MKTQMFRNKWLLLVVSGGVAVAVGCASSSSPSNNNGGNGDDAGGGGGSNDAGGTGGGDDSGGGGTGNNDSGGSTLPAQTLPFFVSDVFAPSGFMGSWTSMTGGVSDITMGNTAATCKTPRQTGAGGDCYTVTWAPTAASLGDAGAAWAGVYWQYPSNNWGTKAGKQIKAGAKEVSFFAAGKNGGETVTFCAGGINANGVSATSPYGDGFTVTSQAITLTTDWQPYNLSLEGTTYPNGVLGGFCWSASTTAAAGGAGGGGADAGADGGTSGTGPGTGAPQAITFYVDNLQWQ
jgi:hypothetical protein